MQSVDSPSLQSLAPPASPPPASAPAPAPAPSSPPLVPVRRKPSAADASASTITNQKCPPIPSDPPTLLSALRSLFRYISSHPAERGTAAPRAFITKLKEVNTAFDSTMHQDAHEFLNYLLNRIVEEAEQEGREKVEDCKQIPTISLSRILSDQFTVSSSLITATDTINSNSGHQSPQDATIVHRLFEGTLTSETRCLTCETVRSHR